jgi:hypothetical protein
MTKAELKERANKAAKRLADELSLHKFIVVNKGEQIAEGYIPHTKKLRPLCLGPLPEPA